ESRRQERVDDDQISLYRERGDAVLEVALAHVHVGHAADTDLRPLRLDRATTASTAIETPPELVCPTLVIQEGRAPELGVEATEPVRDAPATAWGLARYQRSALW